MKGTNLAISLYKKDWSSYLQNPEELLEDVLLPEELLPVPVGGGLDLERLLPVLLVLLIGQEVDDVLQKTGEGSVIMDNQADRWSTRGII